MLRSAHRSNSVDLAPVVSDCPSVCVLQNDRLSILDPGRAFLWFTNQTRTWVQQRQEDAAAELILIVPHADAAPCNRLFTALKVFAEHASKRFADGRVQISVKKSDLNIRVQ